MKIIGRFLLGRTRCVSFGCTRFVLILMWITIKYGSNLHLKDMLSIGAKKIETLVKYGSNLHLEDMLSIRAKKIEILSRMRADLLKSVEAEKNAVMADTDESSRIFADQSRQAAEAIDRDRRELGLLIEKDHSDQEMKLLREFDRSWAS
jgi:hypothetical protein